MALKKKVTLVESVELEERNAEREAERKRNFEEKVELTPEILELLKAKKAAKVARAKELRKARKKKQQEKQAQSGSFRGVGKVHDTVRPADDPVNQAALFYLRTWDGDRSQWKFQKVRQNYLIDHGLNPLLIDEDAFVILLRYFEALQGTSRDRLITICEKVQQDEAVWKQTHGELEKDENVSIQKKRKKHELVKKRCKKILKLFPSFDDQKKKKNK